MTINIQQDVLHGAQGRKKGWIGDRQLAEALRLQFQDSGARAQPLGQVLQENGVIDAAQLEELQTLAVRYRADRERRLYGQLASAKKLAGAEQIQEALKRQMTTRQPLGEILVLEGVLSREQHQQLQRAVAGQRLRRSEWFIGQLALRAGRVDAPALLDALMALQEQLYRGEKVRMTQVLVERKLLTSEQADPLLNTAISLTREADQRLGAEAVKAGLLDHNKLKQALAAQEKARLSGDPYDGLGDLLVAHSLITAEQHGELLSAVGKLGDTTIRRAGGRWVLVVQTAPGRPEEEVVLELVEVLAWIDAERIADLTPIRRESEKGFAALYTYAEFASALVEVQSKRERELDKAIEKGHATQQRRGLAISGTAAIIALIGIFFIWRAVAGSKAEVARKRLVRIEQIEAELSGAFHEAGRAIQAANWAEAERQYRLAGKVAGKLAEFEERAEQAAAAEDRIARERKKHNLREQLGGKVLFEGQWIPRLERERLLLVRRMTAEGKVLYGGKWVTPAEKFRLEQESKGLVEHKGRWITMAERDRLVHEERGEVFWEGRWIKKEEQARLLAERERLAMAEKGLSLFLGKWFLEEEIAELKQIEAGRNGKLLFYNGEWLKPDDAGPYSKVTMKDGKSYTGYYQKKSSMQSVLLAPEGRKVLPAMFVVAVEAADNEQQRFIEQYDEALRKQDREALLALARGARSGGLAHGAKQAYARVHRFDPENEEAAKGLGLVRHEGKWIVDKSASGLVLVGGAWLTRDEEKAARGGVLYFGQWYDSPARAEQANRGARPGTAHKDAALQVTVEVLDRTGRVKAVAVRAAKLAQRELQELFLVRRTEELPTELFGDDYNKNIKERGEFISGPLVNPLSVQITPPGQLHPPLLKPALLKHLEWRMPDPAGTLIANHSASGGTSVILQLADPRHPTLFAADLVHAICHYYCLQYRLAGVRQSELLVDGGRRTTFQSPLVLEGLAEQMALSESRFRVLGYHKDLFRDDLHAIALIGALQTKQFKKLTEILGDTSFQITGADLAQAWAAWNYLDRKIKVRWLLGAAASRNRYSVHDAYSKLGQEHHRTSLEQRYPGAARHLARSTLARTVADHRIGLVLSDIERRLVSVATQRLMPPPLIESAPSTLRQKWLEYNDLVLHNPRVTPRQRGLMAAVGARLWLAYSHESAGQGSAAASLYRKLLRALDRLELKQAAAALRKRAGPLLK